MDPIYLPVFIMVDKQVKMMLGGCIYFSKILNTCIPPWGTKTHFLVSFIQLYMFWIVWYISEMINYILLRWAILSTVLVTIIIKIIIIIVIIITINILFLSSSANSKVIDNFIIFILSSLFNYRYNMSNLKYILCITIHYFHPDHHHHHHHPIFLLHRHPDHHHEKNLFRQSNMSKGSELCEK